jgi:hypothetical protein
MADATHEVILKFTADMAGAEKATPALAKLGTQVEKTAAKGNVLKKSVGDLGQVMSFLPGPVGVASSMLLRGAGAMTEIQEATSTLMKSTGLLANLMKGALCVGVAFAGYKFGEWLATVASGNTVVNKHKAAISDLSKAYDELAAGEVRLYEAGRDANALEAAGFSADAVKTRVDAARKEYIAAYKLLQTTLNKPVPSAYGNVQQYKTTIEYTKPSDMAGPTGPMGGTGRTIESLSFVGSEGEIKEQLAALEKAGYLVGSYNTLAKESVGVIQQLNPQFVTLTDEISQNADGVYAASKAYEVAATEQDKLAEAGKEYAKFEKWCADQVEEAEKRKQDAIAETARHTEAMDVSKIQADQLLAAEESFAQWIAQCTNMTASLYQFVMSTTDFIANSIGQTFANVLVYSQDFGEALDQLWKSIAASIITTIVSMLVQMLILWVMQELGLVATTAAQVGTLAGGTYAKAYSDVWNSVGWPAALFLAPAVASGAAAGLVGGAAAWSGAASLVSSGSSASNAGQGLSTSELSGSGITPFASGGIVTQPTLALVGEAGTEAVIPLTQLESMIGQSGDTRIYIDIDGQRAAMAIVPKIPGVVRRTGVKGL